jgi:hypothetical protein
MKKFSLEDIYDAPWNFRPTERERIATVVFADDSEVITFTGPKHFSMAAAVARMLFAMEFNADKQEVA